MEIIIVALIASGVCIYSLKTILKFIDSEIEKSHKWKLEKYEKDQLNRRLLLSDTLAFKKYQDTMKRETELEKTTKVIDGIANNITDLMNSFGKDYVEIKKLEHTTVNDHLNALDHIIDKEFINFIVLPRVGMPDKPLIDDIEACAREIGDNVITGLTAKYYEIFEIHGLSEDYIFKYIIRECTAKMIKYNRDIRRRDDEE